MRIITKPNSLGKGTGKYGLEISRKGGKRKRYTVSSLTFRTKGKALERVRQHKKTNSKFMIRAVQFR